MYTIVKRRGAESVVFSVNGQEVDRVARAELDTDGVVGLRIGPSLNLHITKIAIAKP